MPWRRLSLILLSICSSALLWAAEQSDANTSRAKLYYGLAEGNYLIGDLRGAENGANQILRIAPDYLPALKLKSRIKLDQGDGQTALKLANQALELAPEDAQAQLLKALILVQLEQHNEAVELIEQVIAASAPDSKDARTANKLLGLLRMADGDWDAAAEAFNNNYLANPDAPGLSLHLASEAYLEKARIAAEKRNSDEALQAINEAISVHKGQTGEDNFERLTQLRLVRARYLTQIGDSEAAIEELRSLNGQQPDNLEVLITLASIYASAAQWDSLEKIIDPIAAQPELVDIALYLEGRAAFAKGRIGTARAKFEEALELVLTENKALHSSLQFYRGLCLDQLDRDDEAIAEVLAALDNGFQPENRDEAIAACRVLLKANEMPRAVPLLEAYAINQIAPDAEVWAMLGRAHQTMGQNALALSAFNESLAINPRQIETRGLRGSLLRKLGDLEGALYDYKNALQLDPENPALIYALGLTQLQLGRLTEAEANIARAANSQTSNASIQLFHSLLAYTIGQKASATIALERYFSLTKENANPSAYYIDYILTCDEDRAVALGQLQARSEHKHSSAMLGYFYAYCTGQLDRKAVLDQAGIADTSNIAKVRICEAAFWMAQHEATLGNRAQRAELLELATQTILPDAPEYQFAAWQLANKP
ncbi:MAG: tetratricopeptide repeat protein [Coraliomargarita sp.]